MPIDYDDVIAVVLEHPWERSSAAVAAVSDWGTGMRSGETDSAFAGVALGCIRRGPDVGSGESCPC